jgi:FtsP/CotA-like multicopper oxidase with cupredoxin domain
MPRYHSNRHLLQWLITKLTSRTDKVLVTERTPMRRFVVPALLAVVFLAGNPRGAFADDVVPCPRPSAGSVAVPPPDLWSQNGVLNVVFNYYTTVDQAGRTLFCFMTPDGLQSPTLHVNPGDTLNVKVTNLVPPPPPGSPTEVVSNSINKCGDVTMTISSLNVHYHGTNTSPACHGDQVIHTIINSEETFNYSLKFPTDEPPGLYWYHSHVHGIAEAAVQGGASGAIIVEGIENIQPAVADLPERVLIIRDMTRPSAPPPGGGVPSWDASLNYVPIVYQPTRLLTMRLPSSGCLPASRSSGASSTLPPTRSSICNYSTMAWRSHFKSSRSTGSRPDRRMALGAAHWSPRATSCSRPPRAPNSSSPVLGQGSRPQTSSL